MGRHFRMYGAPVREEDKRPITRATVKRVVSIFRPYRAKVTLVGVAIVITSGLGIVNPLLIKEVFDQGLHCTTTSCDPDRRSCTASSR